MAAKTIADLDIQGRRVFIRVDFDVPLTPAGGVSDATRIRESLPTIRHAIDHGGRVVLASHLGRPKGKPNPAFSLMPVAACLVELLDRDVVLADEPAGDGAKKVVADLRDGSVAMLENLRFAAGEEANDETFARALASYADVYINDAFTTAHLAHASTAGMTRFVSARGMGLKMEREVKFLGQLAGDVERPFVAILGGANLSDKMGLLESLLGRADAIFVGGVLANTFSRLGAAASAPPAWKVRSWPGRAPFWPKPRTPRSRFCCRATCWRRSGPDAPAGQVVPAMKVPDDLAALDIGPETAQQFAEGLAHARTVFWDGPMGVFDSAPFAAGTIAVAKAVAAVKVRPDRGRRSRLAGCAWPRRRVRAHHTHLDGRLRDSRVHRGQEASRTCRIGVLG